MRAANADQQIAELIRGLTARKSARRRGKIEPASFADHLRTVLAAPDRVPIEFNGEKVRVRKGATLLAAALKNRIRLMHVCGARTICSTCRVHVEGGSSNLSVLSAKEHLALRLHLDFKSRDRLGCQARVEGPVEVNAVFPLCGNLPGD
ncbi:MAG TPA: 2Fe-2S iron-sulfur cluster-binding protein [Candidatus Binataceae bacterium]|jgi:ferredoxin